MYIIFALPDYSGEVIGWWIPGLADVLQQVADLKDATAAGNVLSLS